MRNSLFIAPLLTALLPVLVLYTVLLNSPRHLPLHSLKSPADEPAATDSSFREQLASRIGANTIVIQSPALLFDLDADGKSEAVLYAHAFYHPQYAPPLGREWLLVIGNPPPTGAGPAEFSILARRELRISTSAPHIRLAPLFEDGSTAVILSEDAQPTRLTDNWLFLYRPDRRSLEPLRFSGGNIGGRSGPDAVAGKVELFRDSGALNAEVTYGRNLELRSRYHWNGERFVLDTGELPRPAAWEEALIRGAAKGLSHTLLALQLYGGKQEGRAVAYAEDGHYGYYSLFHYRRETAPEERILLSLIDSVRGAPEAFFRRHGIEPAEGRGFYYLHAAGRFVASLERVLP